MASINTGKIRILHLEDLPSDAEFVERALRKEKVEFEKLVVDNKLAFEKGLTEFLPDIIISDHSLPNFDSIRALQILKELQLNIPFILVTATVSEEFAVEVMKLGADDYVLKDRLQRLPAAVLATLEKHRIEKEQKETRKKINKANRLLAFISRVNQKIIHVKDEEALFRNACGLALELGKFKMAWIGLFDDQNKKITIADQSGIPEEALPLFTNTSYEDAGPQNFVLRTGNYYVCNNIERELEFDSWKQFVVSRGIHSCMVLPIKKSDKIIGTFNLYSTELNFSEKEEMAMLVGVTEDISFALSNFEKAKQHKKTEELVIKNERRFRALIENSTDMKTLTSKEGDLIYGSPSVTKVLGYSLEEFLNKPAANYIHPDNIPDLIKNREDIFQTPGKSFRFQYRFLHKDGTWLWCEGTLTNMLHVAGIRALVSNFRDISEKRKMEEQREFDINNFSALINNTKDLMWSVDKNFNLITSNHPFDEVIKSMMNKVVEKGNNILDASLSTEQSKRYKVLYERAFAGEVFSEIEYTELPVQFWSEISFYPIRNGGEIIGTACHSRDVTERMIAEENLKQNERRLKEAQQLAKIGNWNFDVAKNEFFWSDHLRSIRGLPPDYMPGPKASIAMVHHQDQGRVMDRIKEAKATGKAQESTYRIIRPDNGELRILRSITNTEVDENGNTIRMYGIEEDITELKLAEEERDNILLELENRVEIRTKELVDKNKSILDSINYAKRIQVGLLSRPSQFAEIFTDSFILSLPRDIVSGDFFWCYQKRNKKFIVVADCTGHGVPAALLSIIGNNLLNHIIIDEHIENPSEILELLDIRLAEAVKGDTQEVKDGMDIALCVVDTYFSELYFAGAYRPLFISDNSGKISELAASRCSIGGGMDETAKKFETKRFPIIPGQRIYLSSDGYVSQFGGPKDKKFMKSRFVKTLEEIQDRPMSEQKNALLSTLSDWTGSNEQVDDVMVVGIEL